MMRRMQAQLHAGDQSGEILGHLKPGQEPALILHTGVPWLKRLAHSHHRTRFEVKPLTEGSPVRS